MNHLRLVGIALAAFSAAHAPAEKAPTFAAPADYSQQSNWLCLPGRDDACGKPLATTALNPNGYGSVGRSVPAKNPGVDCFYVYPTVSRDAADNSDLMPGIEENGAAAVQFARFAGVCRPFAPLYRQATLAALFRQAAGRGAGIDETMNFAYADVLAAWRHYLQHHNRGRPFVLIGHSQGTIHLTRLLATEIEGTPVAKRMLSALLIGFNIEVPQGKLVGGSFKQTPLCSKIGQTGCVVTYVSFRAANPPPGGALFGRTSKGGMTVGCTNPARLRNKPTPLDSYWFTGAASSGSAPIQWSKSGPPPTPFLRTDGLVSAVCVNDGQIGYLAVSVNADPKDERTDQIGGEVVIAGVPQPGWGLHTVDMSLAQGDLIALVEAQAAASRRRR